jgi:hypothetical protein
MKEGRSGASANALTLWPVESADHADSWKGPGVESVTATAAILSAFTVTEVECGELACSFLPPFTLGDVGCNLPLLEQALPTNHQDVIRRDDVLAQQQLSLLLHVFSEPAQMMTRLQALCAPASNLIQRREMCAPCPQAPQAGCMFQ